MNIRSAVTAAIVAAAAGAGLAVAPAHAAVTTTTLVTHIANRPDSGNGGTWAYDSFERTLTVTVAANQAGVPAGYTGYTATVADNGSFTAIEGNSTPNQSTAGRKVTHAVKGSIRGGIAYTVTAPSSDSLISQAAPVSENDNFAAPSGDRTTGQWPEQAFASAAGVTVTEGAWSWTYETGCETWADSSTNGDGNVAADGNITGRVCPVPVLTHGQAVYVAATREKVTFDQSIAGWDETTIAGPGAINGHHGWVDGVKGLNTAYYEGLEAKHGYTVLYTPVKGQGSFKQVPGTHTGYVYFVSDTPAA